MITDILESAVFAVASICYGAFLAVRFIFMLPVLVYGGLTITAENDPPNLDVQEVAE